MNIFPVRQLKAFRRVNVKAGESMDVKFSLEPESFAIYDREMKFVIEPGDFLVQAGPSSDNILLTETVTLK